MNFIRKTRSQNKYKLEEEKWKEFLNYSGISSEDSFEKEDLSFEREIYKPEIISENKEVISKPKNKGKQLFIKEKIENWTTFYEKFMQFLFKNENSVQEIKCRLSIIPEIKHNTFNTIDKKKIDCNNYIQNILSKFTLPKSKMRILSKKEPLPQLNSTISRIVPVLNTKASWSNINQNTSYAYKSNSSRNAFNMPSNRSKFSTVENNFGSSNGVDLNTLSFNNSEKASFYINSTFSIIKGARGNPRLDLNDRIPSLNNKDPVKIIEKTNLYWDKDSEYYFRTKNCNFNNV